MTRLAVPNRSFIPRPIPEMEHRERADDVSEYSPHLSAAFPGIVRPKNRLLLWHLICLPNMRLEMIGKSIRETYT